MSSKASGKKATWFAIVVKLFVAICLFAVVWSNRSVQADICDEYNHGSICFTLDETGTQVCQELNDIGLYDVSCLATDLPGGGTGCSVLLCPPPRFGGLQ